MADRNNAEIGEKTNVRSLVVRYPGTKVRRIQTSVLSKILNAQKRKDFHHPEPARRV